MVVDTRETNNEYKLFNRTNVVGGNLKTTLYVIGDG